MIRRITHIGFSDESNWNTGRFRSLSLVTLAVENLGFLSEELRKVLNHSGIKEFKWKKLKGARERFAAIKMCNFAVAHACLRNLRIDVLVWDIEDSRHRIKGRDDIANLQRMYYHLFRNVLRSRWPYHAKWQLFPDEHTAMDWQKIEDYLETSGARVKLERSLFGTRLHREFQIEEIERATSNEQPLLQLADLFAGLAVFSREKFRAFQRWMQKEEEQQMLFGLNEDNCNYSRRDIERFKVLKYLNLQCKAQKLGISLKTNCGLTTPNPDNPINFWFYQPQHPDDKAPIKESMCHE